MLIKSATYFSVFNATMEAMFAPRLSSFNKRRCSQYGLLATAAGVRVKSVPDVGDRSFTLQCYFLKLHALINPLNFGHG